MPLNRRDFLHCSLAAVAPLVVPWHRHHYPLRLGLLVPPAGAAHEDSLESALRGARFGAEEAAHTYEILGRVFELEEVATATSEVVSADRVAPAAASTTWRSGQFAGVVSLIDAAPGTAADGRPLVDARAFSSAGDCDLGDYRFRIGIDAATRAAASAFPASGARAVAELPDAAAGGEIVLWHGALYRYGATQLNDRFTRRFDVPMDEHAWAAWMAVKILAEAGLRARDDSPGALSEWLSRAGVRFDGHKGEPLAFDRRRRLIHPLYRLADQRILQLPYPETDHGC